MKRYYIQPNVETERLEIHGGTLCASNQPGITTNPEPIDPGVGGD